MGVIGGGVFQAIKGFRNAPAVSPRHHLIITCYSNRFLKAALNSDLMFLGCRTQTERKRKCSANESSSDRR